MKLFCCLFVVVVVVVVVVAGYSLVWYILKQLFTSTSVNNC